MNPPQTPDEYARYLESERDIARDLRDEMNKDIGEKHPSLFSGRKTFLQNIVLARMGQSPLFLFWKELLKNFATKP